MSVKKPGPADLSTGRVNQKLRTRDTLVAVAAELIREGRSFSVGDVADLARVGRTTAYRYFPSQEQLLAHAALWKLAHIEHFEFDRIFDGKASVLDKVDALVSASDKSTRDYETEYRAMLRASLDAVATSHEPLPRRSPFRRDMVAKALAGMERSLGCERLERLASAICIVMGIEALIVTRDVCLLPAERAREIKRWAADALVRAALAEAKDKPAKPGARADRRHQGEQSDGKSRHGDRNVAQPAARPRRRALG
jgi:AcrR family transcriptional regulator